MGKQTLDEFTKNGLLRRGDDEFFTIKRLTTGIPQLDRILGGGYAYGRNVLCVGPESTGKTLLAQYLVAAVQQDGKDALLVDAEHSFDRSWWAKSGVDVSKLMVAQPVAGEDAVDLMVTMLRESDSLGAIILDSTATLVPTVVQEKQSGERTVASLATLVTNMYQKIMPINHGAVFFAINQLRDNMSGYDDLFPGGRAQRFNSHIMLHTRRTQWITEGKQRVGYTMEITCRKNKLGPPEAYCEVDVRFEGQLDLMMSYVDEAIERGIIGAGGPWYEYDGQKVLGKDNLRNLMLSDDEARLNAVKEQLNVNRLGAFRPTSPS